MYNKKRNEKDWDDLLNRNEKLAIEVGRLREEVRFYKNKSNELILWKISNPNSNKPSLKHDASTQTIEEDYSLKFGYNTVFRDNEIKYHEISPLSCRNEYETPKRNMSESFNTKTSPQRITEILSLKLTEEGTEKRTQRSVKKPISYKEPSLHVKVRKGFQFFKFGP